MSVENGKVCCNCRHNVRKKDIHNGGTICLCDIDNDRYLGYTEVMTGWCRHWAKERKWEDGKDNS